MKRLIQIIVFFVSIHCSAQTHYVGVGGGPMYSDVFGGAVEAKYYFEYKHLYTSFNFIYANVDFNTKLYPNYKEAYNTAIFAGYKTLDKHKLVFHSLMGITWFNPKNYSKNQYSYNPRALHQSTDGYYISFNLGVSVKVNAKSKITCDYYLVRASGRIDRELINVNEDFLLVGYSYVLSKSKEKEKNKLD